MILPSRTWVLFVCVLAAACGDAHPPRTDGGPVRRVVSLNPSFTEIVATLGRADRLVGRSRWCSYPPEVLGARVVGDAFEVDAEALVAVRPDLVLVQSEKLREELQPLAGRFRIRFVPNDSPDETIASIETIGAELDARAEAATLVATIRKEIERVRALTPPGAPRPRVLCVVNRDPYVVVSRASYVGHLIEIAGGEVAGGAEGKNYPTIALEALRALEPDVIVDATAGNEEGGPDDDARALAYWRNATPGAPAVREGRVHALVEAHLFRPGPRLPSGLAWLRKVIAPR